MILPSTIFFLVMVHNLKRLSIRVKLIVYSSDHTVGKSSAVKNSHIQAQTIIYFVYRKAKSFPISPCYYRRVTLADAQGSADLLGNDHAAEIVDPAHDSGCFHIKRPFAVKLTGLVSAIFTAVCRILVIRGKCSHISASGNEKCAMI